LSVALWTNTDFSKFLEGDFLTILAVVGGCATLNLFNEHARRKQFITSELLRELHEKQEQRILDRTAELRVSNEKLLATNDEHTKTEEALTESNERFTNAFDHAPIMMSISSLDNNICVDVNQRFVDVTGYGKEEIVGKSFIELGVITPADKEKILDALQVNKRVYDLEINFMSKHGKQLIWNYSGQLITIGGNKYLLSASMDITEQKLFEQQLRQSQKMEAIGQLAGGMAHDFNNILTVIMGYGQLLKMNEMHNDGSQEAIDQIISSSEKAARLTGGMLAFSRKQTLMLEYENLNNIVHNVQRFLVRIIGEDIDLQTISNKASLMIRVDIGQIEQVLMNLAANARDAMPKGGILTIKTDIRNIESSFIEEHGFGETGSYAVLSVSDTGSGINKEHLKRIFEPFFTTKEVGKGTGLGMAIVYGIVKQHNGYIDVTSEPGAGTAFNIFLPIVESIYDAPEETPAMLLPEGGFETILLVEDDPDVSKFVGDILKQYGYDVIFAYDGQEAIDRFIENKDRIHMILMDMIMPRKNGKEAYDEIRVIKPEVKILYSSGYTSDFIKDRGVSDESIEIVMKPVNPIVLLQKIRSVLDL
jgi:PAS domain S-box-containing protein